jgi:hypothetical protein
MFGEALEAARQALELEIDVVVAAFERPYEAGGQGDVLGALPLLGQAVSRRVRSSFGPKGQAGASCP